jgi:hypothetical protein
MEGTEHLVRDAEDHEDLGVGGRMILKRVLRMLHVNCIHVALDNVQWRDYVATDSLNAGNVLTCLATISLARGISVHVITTTTTSVPV